jgi:BirA family transcriptional regulator, biotin operon repressor / biotin---[acetyl-CoA-carboxylase] ligase
LNKIQPKSKYLGKNIIFLPTCHSTNDISAEMLQNNDITEGLLVYTDFQTKGRGQRGNTWMGNAGENIMASIILKPAFLNAQNQFNLNIAFSVSLYQTFEPLIGNAFKIKWPNDLYYNEQKIGGVLIENTISGQNLSYSIIGFGINVNQINFENLNATSLKNIRGKDFHIDILYETILENFEKCYDDLKNGQIEKLKEIYLSILFGMKETRSFKKGNETFQGKIIGISENGKLQIFMDSYTQDFDFKEISFVFNS